MTKKCIYCRCYIYQVTVIEKTTCDNCDELIEKFDSDTFSTLMTIIENRVDEEISKHVDRYEHESSNRYY